MMLTRGVMTDAGRSQNILRRKGRSAVLQDPGPGQLRGRPQYCHAWGRLYSPDCRSRCGPARASVVPIADLSPAVGTGLEHPSPAMSTVQAGRLGGVERAGTRP